MAKKILVIDDEGMIRNGLSDFLQEFGYVVHLAENGEKGLEVYKKINPDLILLDIVMPEKDGIEVCREIRKNDDVTPIIFLTTKNEQIDKIVGLEIGADDYVAKPFDFEELKARVRAGLRRGKLAPQKVLSDQVIKFADITIDPKTLKGTKGDKKFEVSTLEMQLLQMFIQHEGEILDRDDILNKVWGVSYKGTTRTLDQHVLNLRKKIENNPNNPVHILTSYGKGYIFNSKA